MSKKVSKTAVDIVKKPFSEIWMGISFTNKQKCFDFESTVVMFFLWTWLHKKKHHHSWSKIKIFLSISKFKFPLKSQNVFFFNINCSSRNLLLYNTSHHETRFILKTNFSANKIKEFGAGLQRFSFVGNGEE